MSIGSWSAFFTPYNEDAVRRVVPPSGGVYALWVYYTTGKWGCFYVGKADNLESRLLAHLRPDEQNECIKGKVRYQCGFYWMGITTEAERSGAEKYLYDTMKPGCNQSDPGGRPVQVPLPPTPPAN
jgi:excinuclease UvrABC nuclease subunit